MAICMVQLRREYMAASRRAGTAGSRRWLFTAHPFLPQGEFLYDSLGHNYDSALHMSGGLVEEC